MKAGCNGRGELGNAPRFTGTLAPASSVFHASGEALPGAAAPPGFRRRGLLRLRPLAPLPHTLTLPERGGKTSSSTPGGAEGGPPARAPFLPEFPEQPTSPCLSLTPPAPAPPGSTSPPPLRSLPRVGAGQWPASGAEGGDGGGEERS